MIFGGYRQTLQVWTAVAGLALFLTAALAEDQAWERAVDAALGQSDKGAAALTLIEKLPIEDRESAAGQYWLARAQQAAGKPHAAAVALATCTLLLQGPAPHDTTPVKAWLVQIARKSFADAITHLKAGDGGAAVKAYLLAVKCDSGILARDDQGLGQRASDKLAHAVRAHPQATNLRFEQGYYLWAQGDLRASIDAFKAYVQSVKDPYDQWLGQLWLAKAKSDDAAQAPASTASRTPSTRSSPGDDIDLSSEHEGGPEEKAADRSAKPDKKPPSPETDPETQARVAELTKEIAKVEAEITVLKKFGSHYVEADERDGHTYLKRLTQTQRDDKTAELEKQKADLEAELASLQ